MIKICHSTLFLLMSGLFIILVGCGGGGSGGGNNNTGGSDNTGGNQNNEEDKVPVDTTHTGFLTNSIIAGITYTTATQSGVTDTSGQFKYKDNETITFSLGDITLGETVIAKSEMTPFDLIPDAIIYTTYNQIKKMYNSKASAPERVTFFKLRNTLAFLHSLDDDSNPDNGIHIPTGIAALVTGSNINFTEDDHYNFELHLRPITNRAASMGLLNSGAIKPFGYALDHSYRAQGIRHNFLTIGTKSVDTDGNGSADTLDTHTFDTNGNRLTYAVNDAAGNPTKIHTYTYDTNGNMLTSSSDSNGDGALNNIHTYTYDTNGNKLTHSNVNKRPDSPEDLSGTHYTYDINGNMLTRSYFKNGDSSPYSINTYTYDTNNNQLTDHNDSDANNIADTIRTNTYDSHNNILTKIYSDGDGTPYNATTYTYTYLYNAQGNKLTESLDDNADGDPSKISTYTYDTRGNKLTFSQDSNGDGNINLIYIYTYDANDNQLTYSRDNTGTDNPKVITSYTYDANNNKLTYSYDQDGAGTPNTTIYTYDSNGNKLTEKRYNYGNDNPRYIEILTYDSQGNLLTSSDDNNGDGTPDDLTTYTYNMHGHLLTRSYNKDIDNDLDQVITYTLISSSWKEVLTSLAIR